MKRKLIGVILALMLLFSLCAVTAVPASANDIASSTIVAEGTLTQNSDGSYTGAIEVVEDEGFDIYAQDGATAWFGDDPGTGEVWTQYIILDHDAWPTWTPDTLDPEWYTIEFWEDSGVQKWALQYRDDLTDPVYADPMSGTMDWDDMYAFESGTGVYYITPEIPGGAAAHGGGPACWDMDWSWGSEVVPLQYPGFSVAIEDLGEGEYRVTFTPAACSGFVTGGGWIDSPEGAVPPTISNVTISGISGDTSTDPDAAYAPYYLRYVGTPPPTGYDPDHNYQWGSPAIFTPSPENGPVTLQGTIDVDEQTIGQVAMIGLLDADDLEAGNSNFQRGAYIYIYRQSATSWKIGPSDGNVGGEIVQTFATIADTDLPADGILDVIFTVDGTVDGTTYAVGPYTAPAGGMTLQITGNLVNVTLNDSYGDVVGNNSASPEFTNGAVLGWDDYLGSNVGFTLTVPSMTGGSPEGKATFGFVSKYKKGANTPDGNTEFVFRAADLNFHSSSYDWLVVNNGDSRAQFKGSGTINGMGDYKFMLWAGDGEPDTFRIKIWEENGEEVVIYDNGFESSGYENGQPIGGGSIIVHVKKK